MPRRKNKSSHSKHKTTSLKKLGFKRASNKTTKFTYYFNPKTKKVFKDTDFDGKKG